YLAPAGHMHHAAFAPATNGYQANYVPQAKTVTMAGLDDRFDPVTIHVQPGTTVQWTNRGKQVLTVTSTDGHWDSGDMQPGASYAATFLRPGTYKLFSRHAKEKMAGTIIVDEPTNANGGPDGKPMPKDAP